MFTEEPLVKENPDDSDCGIKVSTAVTTKTETAEHAQ